ncbi:MAG TPA: protein kinase [Longimicrobiales bacterium]|nr:protein kinase [Longimicrobiales bacterium]
MSDVPDRLTAALGDRYTVLQEIGAGGMATVYLAHDLRHDRRVAVKVLRPELAAIMGAERFLTEIRTTANLQHPHILPLFDSGEADGFLYFVMPYVEGETLRDRMAREKQLPVDDAVRIGVAVAGALDYAHRHDVIHRDINPANILLHDGQPLVDDFGIALAVQQAGEGRLTETGLSLGTPHYMSPEQATADRDPDARSDVYSLACVVYEMLTGEPPFPGTTAQAVLGRIITSPPTAPRDHRKAIPPHLEAVVLKALEKLPADRFGSAAEFAAALGDPAIGQTLVGRSPASGPGVAGGPSTATAWAGLSAILAGLAAWGWLRPPPEAPLDAVRYEIELNDRAKPVGWTPAIARDASVLAYYGDTEEGERLFVKEQGDPLGSPVRGGPESEAWVAFSPDASMLVVSDRTVLRTMPRDGGPSTTLRNQFSASSVAWQDGGTIIVAADSGVVRIPETGGAEEFLPFDGPGRPNVLQALPGGRDFLMLSSELAGQGWAWVYDDDAAEYRQLASEANHVWFVEPDFLVVSRSGAENRGLMAARVDLESLEILSRWVTLPDLVGQSEATVGDLLLSWDGTLIYGPADAARGPLREELSWVDRDGTKTPADSSFNFPAPMPTGGLRLSPDDERVAISLTEPSGATNIFVKRLSGGPAQKLTFTSSAARRPTWRPDGEAILYVTSDGTRESLWQVRADGLGEPTEIAAESRAIFEGLWSPDGDWLIYRTDDDGAEGLGDILAFRPDENGQPVSLAATPDEETTPSLSPDGRWLAYTVRGPGGRKEVFVRPFPDATRGLWQVSSGGGTEPAWSRDGSELFYWRDRDMMAATVATEGVFEVLGTRTLFTARFRPYMNDDGRWYDVAEDGRFLMVTPQEGLPSDRLILVQNFDEVIRRALER